MPRATARRAYLTYALLAAVIAGSSLIPGAMLLGEWESFTIYTAFGTADSSLNLSIAPRGNIGGQGYALLEVSRFLTEHLGVHPSLASIRLPVIICGAVSLLLFFVIARRWFGPCPALMATALLAVNPTFSQYQHELIIAGPSLMAFLLVIERVQATAIRPNRWIGWLTLSGATALTLLVYGPGRILALSVIGLWLLKSLIRAWRREYPLPLVALLLRATGFAGTTVALLLFASPSNARFLGPSLLFPQNSENILVSGTPVSPLEVVGTNLRIVVESLLLGGGSYHSSFLEATLIQGRVPIIPLLLVPLYLAGFLLCVFQLRSSRRLLDSPYAAIVSLAVLTCVPMLSSSVQLLAAGDPLGSYVNHQDMWQATLVNYRLMYFLAPAYLAIAALGAWALRGQVLVRILAVLLVGTLVALGAWNLVHGRDAFAQRVAAADPSLSGPAGLVQWLDGYSLRDRPIYWGSNFQQQLQYESWAAQVARQIEAAQVAAGQTLIVPTSVSCFPEAPLRPLSLGEIIGRNYHNVYLALYLSGHLDTANVGYILVPPAGSPTEIIGEKTGRYSAILSDLAAGNYEYSGADPAAAIIRGLAGSDPDVIVTTTPTELAAAKSILSAQGRTYDVATFGEPCWSSGSNGQSVGTAPRITP